MAALRGFPLNVQLFVIKACVHVCNVPRRFLLLQDYDYLYGEKGRLRDCYDFEKRHRAACAKPFFAKGLTNTPPPYNFVI